MDVVFTKKRNKQKTIRNLVVSMAPHFLNSRYKFYYH